MTFGRYMFTLVALQRYHTTNLVPSVNKDQAYV